MRERDGSMDQSMRDELAPWHAFHFRKHQNRTSRRFIDHTPIDSDIKSRRKLEILGSPFFRSRRSHPPETTPNGGKELAPLDQGKPTASRQSVVLAECSSSCVPHDPVARALWTLGDHGIDPRRIGFEEMSWPYPPEHSRGRATTSYHRAQRIVSLPLRIVSFRPTPPIHRRTEPVTELGLKALKMNTSQ